MDSIKPYYEEGSIKIYHADWLDIDQKLMEADLLLTDPPYGIGESSKNFLSRGKPFGSKGTNRKSRVADAIDYGKSDWDDEAPDEDTILRMRELAPYQMIFGGNYFHLPPSRCWLVWDKVNSGDFADCELIWTNLDKAVRLFRYMWNGMLKEQPEKRYHPTQKPLSLMKWCISQAPDTIKSIIDPYCGSGTTLLAAKEFGLAAIGVEREERYCEIAAERLRQGVFSFSPENQDSVSLFQGDLSSLQDSLADDLLK